MPWHWLLATIESIEPTSWPLLGIMGISAAMYAVGILLPGCSCCGQPCSTCTEGELPETVTVTFAGFTDRTPGPDLCSLQFTACFGGGAAGRVLAPGGDHPADAGPISSVAITNAGSGYAKLGRVEPTVSAGGGSGDGATLTVTLTQSQDECDVDRWAVTAVSVSGGTGYADGDQVTFGVAAGDTEQTAAAATIHTTRTAPTLTATASPGGGAVLAVVVDPLGTTPATWAVSDVTVTSGGTGYFDGNSLSFGLGSGDIEQYAAYAIIHTNRLEPTLAAFVTSATGSLAELDLTLSASTDYYSRDIWAVASITATDGGSGYEVGDTVGVTVSDGQAGDYSYFSAAVSSVDESGVITGISIDYAGEYFKDGGVIESIDLYDGGSYYNDDGEPVSVSVEGGGIYYREDASEPPYVADVTITIDQDLPSDGAGAVLTATVEDDTASANFGKITAVAITDAGDDYLAWRWRNTKCCGHYYNGMSLVLRRSGCVYSHSMCGVGNLLGGVGLVTLTYAGPSTPPTLSLISELGNEGIGRSCNTTFVADETLVDCGGWSSLEFSATSSAATATVSQGGEYDATFRNPGGFLSCFICCKGDGELPAEIEAEITDNTGGSLDGVYVFGFNEFLAGGRVSRATRVVWGVPNFSPGFPLVFQASLGLCGNDTQNILGFSGDCDKCHKQCSVKVIINTANSGLGTNYYTQGFFDGECVGCDDTPVCGPYGAFTLTSPSESGSFTVSIT